MNNWLRVIAFLTFLGLSACGGGGDSSSPPPGPPAPANTAPTANFAFSCTDVVCSFTNTSTDQDQGDTVVTYNWTFGDGSMAATTLNAAHTFPAGGTYNVTLEVGDRSRAMSTVVKSLTVTALPPAGTPPPPVGTPPPPAGTPPPPAGTPAPAASFTISSCLSLDCVFTDTSTYGAGLQSRLWDFGDGVTLASTDPATTVTSHKYAVATLTSFTVRLTVTDTAGKVSTSIGNVSVAPAATTLDCGVSGGCVLTLTQAASVTATIKSSACTAIGNQVVITAPVQQTMFADACRDPIEVPVPVNNAGNKFAAGTSIELAVLSGLSGTTGLVFPPALRVTGDFTQGWTMTFDDGAGGPGEPDFDDLIILIKATP
jgi:PKD repeat protein